MFTNNIKKLTSKCHKIKSALTYVDCSKFKILAIDKTLISEWNLLV